MRGVPAAPTPPYVMLVKLPGRELQATGSLSGQDRGEAQQQRMGWNHSWNFFAHHLPEVGPHKYHMTPTCLTSCASQSPIVQPSSSTILHSQTTRHTPFQPKQQTSTNTTPITMSRSKAPIYIGTAVAGGLGYYLYSAGGSPKVAQKEFESEHIPSPPSHRIPGPKTATNTCPPSRRRPQSRCQDPRRDRPPDAANQLRKGGQAPRPVGRRQV